MPAAFLGCLSFQGLLQAADPEFPLLAKTPYPAQHANPRNSDYTPYTSPTQLRLKWKALENSSIVQGCTTDRGQLYCARGWDRTTDRCNLVVLDEKDGRILWEDRVDGRCLLDEYASLTNPTVDRDGNLYINDSEKIVSFTADGTLRWTNSTPGTLPSRKDLINAPFGLVLLASGELATATLGDGWILFLDSGTGELTRELLDLPAEKRALEKTTRLLLPDSRPQGFMENLMSPGAAQVLWDFAFGESDFETDNNIAVDETHQLLFISSGAPYPNTANTGALWAVSYADGNPEVAFYVALDVEGGIATTPTVTRDNRLVLIGDNARNLVTVDIERCLAGVRGEACTDYKLHPISHDLTSSVIVTDKNLLVMPSGQRGYAAYQLGFDEDEVKLEQIWETSLAWFPIGVSVHLAFDNVVWIPFYHIGRQQPFIVALDIETGEEVARYKSGDAANVTMASDGRTLVANIMSFIESNFLGRLGFEVRAGVWAWEPVE